MELLSAGVEAVYAHVLAGVHRHREGLQTEHQRGDELHRVRDLAGGTASGFENDGQETCKHCLPCSLPRELSLR